MIPAEQERGFRATWGRAQARISRPAFQRTDVHRADSDTVLGLILIHEKMRRGFSSSTSGRHGAHVVLCDPHRALVSTVAAGEHNESPDIRGHGVLIAALRRAKARSRVGRSRRGTRSTRSGCSPRRQNRARGGPAVEMNVVGRRIARIRRSRRAGVRRPAPSAALAWRATSRPGGTERWSRGPSRPDRAWRRRAGARLDRSRARDVLVAGARRRRGRAVAMDAAPL